MALGSTYDFSQIDISAVENLDQFCNDGKDLRSIPPNMRGGISLSKLDARRTGKQYVMSTMAEYVPFPRSSLDHTFMCKELEV